MKIGNYDKDERCKRVRGEIGEWAAKPDDILGCEAKPDELREIINHHIGVCYEIAGRRQKQIDSLELENIKLNTECGRLQADIKIIHGIVTMAIEGLKTIRMDKNNEQDNSGIR